MSECVHHNYDANTISHLYSLKPIPKKNKKQKPIIMVHCVLSRMEY